MIALLKKELYHFFGNLYGYLWLSIFVSFCTLYLFFFEGAFNLLEGEYVSIENFFTLAPWALLFLIPALTMRSFSEERQQGTLEILFTQPLTRLTILLSKFTAIKIILLTVLLPTAGYFYTVTQLTVDQEMTDLGVLIMSYGGLLCVMFAFASIGLAVSVTIKNQISAYLLSLFACFFFYIGFDNLASFNIFGAYDYWVERAGMLSHYETFLQGVLSIQSVSYFLFIILGSLSVAYFLLLPDKRKYPWFFVGLLLGVLFVMQFLFSKRMDLTQDKRHTLAPITQQIVKGVEDRVSIEIYLKGEFPADLRTFEKEVQHYLTALVNLNDKLTYEFIDPLADQALYDELLAQHINPVIKRVKTQRGAQEFIVFPYAKVSYNGKQHIFPLIEDIEQPMASYAENLDFIFTQAIKSVVQSEKPTIGIFVHHGEFQPDKHQTFYDLLGQKYNIKPFIPQQKDKLTEEEAISLQQFDALMVVKPISPFTDYDKQAIDQYIMKGGKLLWMIDGVTTELDSLQRSGRTMVLSNEVNVRDLLFRYGVRINPDLIADYAQNAPISLITSEMQGQPVFTEFKWPYFPLSNYSPLNHPISRHITPVRFEFVSSIDTLKTAGISKKVLLASSESTAVQGTLTEVDLEMVKNTPDLTHIQKERKIMAVLLEGAFTSAYEHKVKVFTFPYTAKSQPNKMIIIADGNLADNTRIDGQLGPIGGDRAGLHYGNESFLFNALDYLLDEDQIFLLKDKSLRMLLLDQVKIQETQSYWQWFNLIMPLLFIALLAFILMGYRYWRYAIKSKK